MQNINYQNLELLSTSKLTSILTHAPILVHFSKNSNDFVVREIPLYKASGNGEHLMICLQKKGLSTNEALKEISAFCGVKIRDIGFAGLKDKQGLTSQFITLPAKFKKDIEKFSHENIKILSCNLHNNKLRTGHLRANSFFIRLKKVNKINALKIEQACKNLQISGLPNYFGYQRFGKFNDNAKAGYELLNNLKNGIKSKLNPKMQNFLISAFQSELFNRWLSKRVQLSHLIKEFSINELCNMLKFDKNFCQSLKNQPQFFKIFLGDVLGHYPFGAIFNCEDLNSEITAFNQQNKSVQGPLFGKKMFNAKFEAKSFEDEIIAPFSNVLELMQGTRRTSIIWPSNLECKFDEENAQFSLSFELIKGAYATNFLREILAFETNEILDI